MTSPRPALAGLCLGGLIGCSAPEEPTTSFEGEEADTGVDTGAFDGDTGGFETFDECTDRLGSRRSASLVGKILEDVGLPRTGRGALKTLRTQADLDALWEQYSLAFALEEPSVDFSSAQVAVFVGWKENSCEGSQGLDGFYEDLQAPGSLVAKVHYQNTDSGCDCVSDGVNLFYTTEIVDISACFYGVK